MFNWFRRKEITPKTIPYDPRTPLFRWNDQDVLSIGDSYEGIFVCGRTGSGKSSATGRFVALSELAAGYGGLVLTVKAGEAAVWTEYCRQMGRLDDLCIVDASCKYRFNFLQALQDSQGQDAGLTQNVVSLLMEMGQIGNRQSGNSSAQGDNAFFQQACGILLRNTIDLLVMATGKISVSDLCRLVSALPKSSEQVISKEWQQTSPCYRLLQLAEKHITSPRMRRDYEAVLDYILVDFPTLADRTRSSITATFMAFADLFQRGLLYELFSQDTTLSPAEIDSGKIILIDLPLKLYGEVGLTAQLVWKLMTQRMLERRVITPNTRPAFIHIDEAQFFASSQSDALFATTCRAAKVSLILLSQSISGFDTAFGGNEMGKALTQQLLANLSAKVIHATGDSGTAVWAAELCGKSSQFLCNASNSGSGFDWAGASGFGSQTQSTAGFSESIQYEVEPREFSYLRTGGPQNNFLVDGILIRSGTPLQRTGKIWMPIMLSQK